MNDALRTAAPRVLILADLHLSESLPATVAAFERFLSHEAREACDVYILGDLFEFWIGDDMLASPFAARVAEALAALRRSGVGVHVMHGNRDFLLGPAFAARSGARLMADRELVQFGARRVLLLHGDTLCTDDVGYQRFRRLTRRRCVQRFFLAWPLRWRLALASRMRANSERSGAGRVAYTDATPAGISAALQVTPVDLLVHGHTHRPACHRDAAIPRWVLPDWELDTATPRGGYLCLDADGVRLIDLPEVIAARQQAGIRPSDARQAAPSED